MVVCLNGQYIIMSDTSCVIHFVSPNSLSLSVTKPSVSLENIHHGSNELVYELP